MTHNVFSGTLNPAHSKLASVMAYTGSSMLLSSVLMLLISVNKCYYRQATDVGATESSSSLGRASQLSAEPPDTNARDLVVWVDFATTTAATTTAYYFYCSLAWFLCMYHCILHVCMCSIVTWWGRPGGIAPPLPANRHHWISGDCLEGKRKNYQVCSVQYCVQQLYTVNCTHIWTLNRPNSSLDWVLSHWDHFTVRRFIFVYVLFCVWLYIACMCTV